MPDRNQKMDSEEGKKCDVNEAGSSINGNSSNSHDAGPARPNQSLNIGVCDITGASPPKFVSLEEILRATNGMKNMALAHEIAMDKNFKLQKFEPENSLQSKVKEIMHKAFWDVLAARLNEDPPDYTQALVLLEEIKETLDVLVLPHHKKIRESIAEVLDIDLIRQQAEKGVLNFHHYAQYIIGIMGKVCAPVRDENIEKLMQCTDVIETFRGIMETLQLMRLDLANFTITMVRSNITVSSIEYEKAKFAEILKVQPDGLRYTREWLLRHLDEEKINRCLADPNSIKQITHLLVSEAYLDTMEWEFSLNVETLMLDEGRLTELRNKVNRLGIIGSIYLMANNVIGAPIQGVSSFKQNIKQHLSALLESVNSDKDLESVMPNIVLQVKNDVAETLQTVGAAPMTKEIELILEGQIMEMVKPDHKIRHLVYSRIKQFLHKIIMIKSVTPQQIPPGLSSLQEELAAVAAQFLVLVAHNRNVFDEYYAEIVSTAISNRRSADQATAMQT